MTGRWVLDAAGKAVVDEMVLDYIVSAYTNRPSHRPEPTITVAEVSGYLEQHGRTPEAIKGIPRWIYRATYASIKRLLRAGSIEGSWADVNNRETRCYNPKESR